MANEENILMADIPVPDNCAIIIFSATGGGTTEGGRIRQNIAFTAKTAVSISGGMLTDWVRIEPNGNTFTAAARFHKASGSGTFTATVTTAGDAANGLQGVTVDFSFRVLVLGVDFPHLTQSFYEFPVGAEVAVSLPVFFAAQQAQLNLPKVPSVIVSQTYGELESYADEEHGGITRQRWLGEESGISIDPVLDGQNYVRGAGLSGIALRPGIYYRTFDISSYDNGGGYDPFPGANGSGIVIINIYDDRESPKVVVPYSHVPEDDFIRVIRHAIEGYAAARLTGEFTRSGDMWTRRVEEAISANVSDIWEYRMVRNAETGVWTLSGRNYLSGQAAPDYAELATASGRFGEVPPNTGWSGGVLCAGDADFFVSDHGFFDRKGVRTIGEFTGPVYEQQPMVAAQHAGWSNPPATRFADGLYLASDAAGAWRISADPAAVNGAEVITQTIQHAAIPYHPATAGHPIAGQNYRDFALPVKQATGNPVAINASLPTGGNLALQTGRYAAGVPSHYPWLRQLPPPVGNETARTETMVYGLTSEHRSNSYSAGRDYQQNWYPGGGGSSTTYSYNTDEGRSEASFTGTASLNCWMRSGGLIYGTMAAYDGMPPGSVAYQYRRDQKSDSWNTSDVSGTYNKLETHDTASLKEVTGGDGKFMLVAMSGRNEHDPRVSAYAAGAVSTSASFSTDTTHRVIYEYPGSGGEFVATDETGESTGGASIIGHSVFPAHVSLSSFVFEKLTESNVSASLSVTNNVQRWGSYSGAPPEGDIYLISVTLFHERTVYSGEELPPGCTDFGVTHRVETIHRTGLEDVVTDEWFSDNDGGLYNQMREDALDVDQIEDPGPWSSQEEDGGYSYHFEVYQSSTEIFDRTETSAGV